MADKIPEKCCEAFQFVWCSPVAYETACDCLQIRGNAAMANDIGDIGLLSPVHVAAEPLNTGQFDRALDDAEVLLAYAASKGLLPPAQPGNLVEGIVQARQARLV